MKKITVLIAICLLMGSVMRVMAQTAPEINALLGKGINLSMFEYEDWDNTWNMPEYPNSDKTGQTIPWDGTANTHGNVVKPYIDRIAELGFKHIRLPICWEFKDRSSNRADDNYKINDSFIYYIKQVVDYVISKDMMIIINMHHHKDFMKEPDEQKARFESQWGQIASYFQAYPTDKLLFEIQNEPYKSDDGKSNVTPELWNTLFKAGLDKIRETNPTRTVLVGCATGGGMGGLTYLNGHIPQDDDYLLVTVHYYNPHSFTHQGAAFGSSELENHREDWRNKETEQNAILAEFEEMKRFSQDNSVPIHIGEYGILGKQGGTAGQIDDLYPNARRLWTSVVANAANAAGFSSAYWEFHDQFGIYNPETEKYRTFLVDAILTDPMPEALPMVSEMVYESKFDQNDKSSWTMTNGSLTTDNGALAIQMGTITNNWENQLYYSPIPLVQDESYRLSFTIATSVDNNTTSMPVRIGRHVGGYDNYSGDYTFTPASGEVGHTYTFTSAGMDDDARITFDFYGFAAGDKFYLKEVKLERLRDATNNTWTGSADNDWNNPLNWESGRVPNAATNVYISGKGVSNYPYLTGDKANNVCNNIYILQGGEIGRQDLLTYKRAHIQMNWNLTATTQQTSSSKQPGSDDFAEYLSFSAGNSSIIGGDRFSGGADNSKGRERWMLITAPLKGMYSGDFSFGGYPNTYMQDIRVENKEAQWSKPFAAHNVALKAGVGFALFVREGRYNGALGYREDDGNGGGLLHTNGIVEFPYYENQEMSAAHRIHSYSAGNKTSDFYYVYTDNYEISTTKESVARNPDADYRFIMEDENGDQETSLTIASGGLAAGSEVLVGNPYMSTIDFEKLRENNSMLGNYYRIWTGNGYKSYLSDGSGTGGLTQYIAPMQSFLVGLNQDVDALTLRYEIEQLSVSPAAYPGLKNAKASDASTVLKIKAANAQFESEALLVAGSDFSDSYTATEDVYKLFTNIGNVPEVYTVSDGTAVEINCIGRPEELILPLGLKTNAQGRTTFTLSGMNRFDEKNIYLTDKYLGNTIDITGQAEYEYSFDNVKTGRQDDRFVLEFTSKATSGLDEIDSGCDYIHVYPTSTGISVTSSAGNPILSLQVHDLQGCLLYDEANIHATQWKINLSESNNLYLVNVITQKGSLRTKIIK